jgi:hypothetical protein
MPVWYQPNPVIWLESVAALVFLKGLLEIALAWRVFWQSHWQCSAYCVRRFAAVE